MASTYTNDLRLELIATGEAAATWGDKTNVNLTNIAAAFGYATQDGFAANADSTTTVADGVADPARAMYFKVTSSATLTATRTLTIAPDTISRLMWIENATTGGQSIAISQGTGANVTIPTGKTAVVYLDGAGSGASVVDAMAGVSSGASDTLAEILAAGNTTGGTDLAVSTGDDITFADNSKAIFGAGSDLEISSDGTTGQVTGNVNVTGSVTADGLTVDGDVAINSNSFVHTAATPSYKLIESDVTDENTQLIQASGTFRIRTADDAGTLVAERMRIDHGTGDISFYNNAAAQGLFWDSSASALGLGTTTPSSYNSAGDDLVIASAGAGLTIASAANDSGHILFADSTTGTGAYTGFIRYDHTTDSMRFAVNAGVERLRIDASGVRVGTGGTVITGLTNGPNLVVGDAAGGEIVAYKNTNAIADGDFVGAFLFGNDDNSGTEDHFAGMWAKASGTQGSMNLHFAGGRSDYEAGTAHMTLDSIGNLGLGTSTPSDTYNYGRALDLQSSTGAAVYLRDSDNTSNFGFASYDGGENRCVIGGGGSAYLRFISAGAECGRFASSGSLLVGRTTENSTDSGHRFAAAGFAAHIVANDYPLLLNRLSSDGALLTLRKDSVTVGSIGANGGTIYFSGPSAGGFKISYYNSTNATIFPVTTTGAIADGLHDIGYSASRWRDIYATNGTIQTSDRNEKQDIVELSDAEQRVAVAAKGLLRKFRWKSSVAEKGDEARTHFGIIAQDLQAAFEAEGLDAGDYAMFIHSTWTDEETGEERSRMGVRYSELLAFIIAAI